MGRGGAGENYANMDAEARLPPKTLALRMSHVCNDVIKTDERYVVPLVTIKHVYALCGEMFKLQSHSK